MDTCRKIGLFAFIGCALATAFNPCRISGAEEGGAGTGVGGKDGVRSRDAVPEADAGEGIAAKGARTAMTPKKAAGIGPAVGEGSGANGKYQDKPGDPVRGNGAAALLAILKEARELEATLAREEAEWKAEERESKAVLAQRRARLEDVEKRRAEMSIRVSRAERELEEKRRRKESLAAEEEAWREWMSEAVGRARAELSRRPFLSEKLDGSWNDSGLDRAAADVAGKRLGEAAASFWNAMLGICARGTEAEVRMTSVKLNGAAGEMPVLRIGGIGAVCLSRDESSCATAVARGGGIAWIPVPEKWRAAARHAVRVGRRDIAADLIIAPIPIAAVIEDSGKAGEDKR